MSTPQLSTATVVSQSLDTISEWLTGYAYRGDGKTQDKVSLVEPIEGLDEQHVVLEYRDCETLEARHFAITVTATEVTA